MNRDRKLLVQRGWMPEFDSVILERYRRLRLIGHRECFAAIAMEYIAVMAAVSVGLHFMNLDARTDMDELSPASLFIQGVLFAPLFETLLFQSLFCLIGTRLRLPFVWLVVFMTVPFAAAHFAVAVSTGLLAGCVLGFYLSLMYASRIEFGFRAAFLLCAALHSLNNFVFIGLIIVGRSWG